MLSPAEQMLELNTVQELHERGFVMHGPPIAIASLDPAGSGTDHPALTVIEREVWRMGEVYDPDLTVMARYVLRGAWIFPQGSQFPQITGAMLAAANRMMASERDGQILRFFITVECNGVGWGYASHLRAKLGDIVMPITTTGGENANVLEGNKGYTMPRQAAADNLRMLMEQQVWKVERGAPGIAQVQEQLDAFVWKGKKPQAAEGFNDDGVLSIMIGTWALSRTIPLSVQIEARSTRVR
jgi:hypothetical protein